MKSFFIPSQNTVEGHVGAKFQVDWSRNNFMKMPYPIIYCDYFLIRFPQTKVTLFVFFNNWVNKGKKSFLLVEPRSRVTCLYRTNTTYFAISLRLAATTLGRYQNGAKFSDSFD